MLYGKAGMDFDYWQRCRHERAGYFLSRVKAGMVYGWPDNAAVAAHDPRNRGVTQDRRSLTRDGHRRRILGYTEPLVGQAYEFLTHEPDLPAGVLAELDRRRWEVEEVFDELKNKLRERKAWGTSLVAKSAQGQLVAIPHNLMLLYEGRLERAQGGSNGAEDQRRAQRTAGMVKLARKGSRPPSVLLAGVRVATQRSVKFIRWLRHALRENLTEAAAVPRLTTLYASL